MSGPPVYRHSLSPLANGIEPRGADIFTLVRRLLDEGTITPDTRLETWRGSTLCQHGIAAELAKWEVVGSKFRPFSASRVRHKCAMIHKVDLTGDYETTIYDVARRLLAEGADPGDRVETRRHGIQSMSGVVGKLAKWQVVFATPGPRLVRHKAAFQACWRPNRLNPYIRAYRPRKRFLAAPI